VLKNKSLLAGLGIGLIVGALLLQTMTFADRLDNQEPTAQQPEVQDEEQLEDEADRLGYALIQKDTTYFTEEQLAARIEEARQQAIEETASTIVERKSFIIVPGTRPGGVSDMLHTLELIADKQVFLDELSRRGLTTKIISGMYTFEGTPEMDAIIREITLDPETPNR